MKVQSVQQSQEDINMKEKVVLAYSGGLDTTAIIPWLKEHFGYEVKIGRASCRERVSSPV